MPANFLFVINAKMFISKKYVIIYMLNDTFQKVSRNRHNIFWHKQKYAEVPNAHLSNTQNNQLQNCIFTKYAKISLVLKCRFS